MSSPGWYPDPDRPGSLRWFDGFAWADSWQPAITPPIVAPVYVADEPNAALVVIAWIVALLTLLYMLPWAIAASVNSRNQVAVLLVNIFLGWTLVGWLVAFVLAFTGTGPRAVYVAAPVGPLPYVTGPYPGQPDPPPPPTGL